MDLPNTTAVQSEMASTPPWEPPMSDRVMSAHGSDATTAKRFARRTIVVAGGAAADAARLAHARQGAHGAQVVSVEGLAARLAGGFLAGIDADTLAGAVTAAVSEASTEALGDLGAVAALPGLPSALGATLSKAWAAGLDVAALAQPDAAPRLGTLARLEEAILARLPAAMLRPGDLVDRAIERLGHAPAVLGEVEFRVLPDLDPCWRPLVSALSRVTPVVWNAGTRAVPAWVRASTFHSETVPPKKPQTIVFSCATARHEVTEAMRWARSRLAEGVAAQDIAFAAASPGEYDDLVLALSAEANLDVHFAHGRRALGTRDGQGTAALADILLRGLTQDRVRRLARLAKAPGTPFGDLPEDWSNHLPRNAPLESGIRWQQALAEADAPAELATRLLSVIEVLEGGLENATEAGETFLRGPARLLWRRALVRAPASALETSLGALRLVDQVEAATSISWMHAAALASCPRPHVWLFGLNSRAWPRRSSEDPLLPNHILPTQDLEPRSVTEDDRDSFATIMAATESAVACSFGRRGADGRLLGRSALLPKTEPVHLYRARVPDHAMSEPDRMMACPGEFVTTARAISAAACWRDWHRPDLTPHDGLVRSGHPVLLAALGRAHSASSLRLLLRNPLGFVWKYALGWRAPDLEDAAFDLDASTFGSLVHDIVHAAVRDLEAGQGLAASAPDVVRHVVERARDAVGARWAEQETVPPSALWTKRLGEASAMAAAALSRPLPALAGQRSLGEIEFPDSDPASPWASVDAIEIPGTGLRIEGRIDRLDLSGDGRHARVIDYKTGKVGNPVVLNGGRELQRCLYACAVQAVLGPEATIDAALFYPHDEAAGYRPLEDRAGTLAILTEALLAAKASLLDGAALPGVDAGNDHDDLRFALPASPGSFLDQKQAASRNRLGEAATIWDQP